MPAAIRASRTVFASQPMAAPTVANELPPLVLRDFFTHLSGREGSIPCSDTVPFQKIGDTLSMDTELRSELVDHRAGLILG
jgi:hypothetical protein